MRKLQLLTAVAGVLLALTGPSLAAKRIHNSAADAYARDLGADRSGAYYYGPVRGGNSYAASPGAQGFGGPGYSYGTQQNLPYPDRPYGAPDGW
jgi:hypothetical protein